MARGEINLHVGAVVDRAGFAQSQAQLRSMGRAATSLQAGFSALNIQAKNLPPILGKIGSMSALLTGGLLSTAVWMGVAFAIEKVWNWMKKLNDQFEIFGKHTTTLEDYKKRMAQLSKGYERRVASYSEDRNAKAAIEAEKGKRGLIGLDKYDRQIAQAELNMAKAKLGVTNAEAAMRAAERSGDPMQRKKAKNALTLAKEQEQTVIAQETLNVKDANKGKWMEKLAAQIAHQQIIVEREKTELYRKHGTYTDTANYARDVAKNENAAALREVANAKLKVDVMQDYGSAAELVKAMKELELAIAKQTTVTKKTEVDVRRAVARENKEKYERQRKYDVERQRKQLEADIAAAKEKGGKHTKTLEEQIAALQQQAPIWQEAHQAALDAGSPAEWMHNQEVKERNEAKEKARQQKKFDLAKKEYMQIWERTHDPRTGRLLSTATKADLERMRKLNKLGQELNPANDPAKLAEKKAKELREAQLKTAKNVEEITKKMKDLGL